MAQRARHLGRSNLPAELTSFVGRRQELREVKRLLGSTRLLTLTGSAGAGKTRLALRAAADMSRGFPDGAWLVSLGPVQDPMLVPQAVFGALGVHDLSAGASSPHRPVLASGYRTYRTQPEQAATHHIADDRSTATPARLNGRQGYRLRVWVRRR